MSEVELKGNGLKKNIKSFIDKFKKMKKTELLIICILIILALFIYFNSNQLLGISSKNENDITTTISSTNQYITDLETRLSNVLSKVHGAGNVSVMISIESGSEIVVATSSENKTNTSTGSSSSTQSSTTVEKPIIIGDAPLILMEKLPKIKGVIVVAQGAENVQVRLELLRAVQALLDIDANNIEIFVGNKKWGVNYVIQEKENYNFIYYGNFISSYRLFKYHFK